MLPISNTICTRIEYNSIKLFSPNAVQRELASSKLQSYKEDQTKKINMKTFSIIVHYFLLFIITIKPKPDENEIRVVHAFVLYIYYTMCFSSSLNICFDHLSIL